ncbi:MAG: zinc-ribbon domain-containing protein [Clostridia bacterium]|nr:zinc-ribbon domain-containing protein [Clostridia bacterium]
MKNCPNCNTQLDDNAVFCAACGAQLGAPQQPTQGFVNPQPYAPAYDPYDHTAEFDTKDISENKVFAMLVYLLGTIGVIIALLASNTSPYARFHVRQGLKFTVVEILTVIVSLVLCWTIIVPIAGAIFLGVLEVIKIICFFQICSGKAKEPAIIKGLKFLK